MIRSTDILVRDLYGLMAEEMSLEGCLDLVAPAFGSHVTGLHTEDFGLHRSSLLIRGGLGASDLLTLSREYSEQWSGQNLWIERSIPGYISYGYQSTDDVIGDEELLASPYYNHYLKRFDVRHGLGICLWTDRRDTFVVAAFNHSPSAGPITPQQKTLAQHLQPHLANLYAIYRRLARMEEATGSMKAWFDRVPIGMLVLDSEGGVLRCNAKAEEWLTPSNGLFRQAGGALCATERGVNAQLKLALKRLVHANPPSLPETLLVPRSSLAGSRSAMILHLCAFPDSAGDTLARRGKVIGFLYEANATQQGQIAHHVLQGVFGLTGAETRVAVLMLQHKDPVLVAATLGVTLVTVRTHLKHLFRKTRTQRQSELVLLVDRLVSLAPVGNE